MNNLEQHNKHIRLPRFVALIWCIAFVESFCSIAIAQSASPLPKPESTPSHALQLVDAHSDSLDNVTDEPASEASRGNGSDAPQGEMDGGDGFISVSQTGTVEMHVANLPLTDVLEALSIQGHHNIVATPSVSGTVSAHLYDVTFTEALSAVLASNGASFREKDGFIYVYTNAELANVLASETPAITHVFTLSFCSSADAIAVVTPMLSGTGSVVAAPAATQGLGSAETSSNELAQADYLAVRDNPFVLKQVEEMLRKLDVPPAQVLLEATILAISLNEDNALGVDFTVVGGVDLELLGAMSNAVTSLNLGNLPTNRFERFNSNLTTDLSANIPTGGVTFGVIKDQVGVFVRALEAITDTTVLANPKILALNRQRGQVIIGRRDGFLTTTVTETQAIQNVEFLETGTQLVFRPFIGKNGLVRMELHPEDSVGTVTNGLPSEQTTEVTTNVMVRDGQTILIGGLFREVTSDTRSQVPFFGNVPLIGPLFQGRRDATIRQEVIILLTVHIIKNQEEYAERGEILRQDIERLRVGIRQNMMPHGRERQAQAHYRKSLEYMAHAESNKALWEARMALRLNPHLLPAIKLKEEILGSRQWDEDGMVARDYIHELIMSENGLMHPDFDRSSPKVFEQAATNESTLGETDETP